MAKRKSSDGMTPTVAVGKNGVTEGVITEIRTQLKTRKTIKVKLYCESKLSRFEVARELAERSNSKLADVRGFTVLLSRKKVRL